MNKVTEQHFFDLLSLKLSGDASESQLAEITSILQANPSLQFLYDQIIEPVYCEQDASIKAEQAYASHFVKMQLAGLFDKEDEVSKKKKLIRKDLHIFGQF